MRVPLVSIALFRVVADTADDINLPLLKFYNQHPQEYWYYGSSAIRLRVVELVELLNYRQVLL